MEDDDVSCAQFYPHHFSALGEDGLTLTPGTHIEEEMQIVVNTQSKTRNLRFWK